MEIKRRKTKNYWDKYHDELLNTYLNTDDDVVKRKIELVIYDKLSSMFLIILNRYFYYDNYEKVKDMKQEVLSHTFKKINEYDPSKGKWFSYLGYLIKNNIITQLKNNNIRKRFYHNSQLEKIEIIEESIIYPQLFDDDNSNLLELKDKAITTLNFKLKELEQYKKKPRYINSTYNKLNEVDKLFYRNYFNYIFYFYLKKFIEEHDNYKMADLLPYLYYTFKDDLKLNIKPSKIDYLVRTNLGYVISTKKIIQRNNHDYKYNYNNIKDDNSDVVF